MSELSDDPVGKGHGPKKGEARKHPDVIETGGLTEKDTAKSLLAHSRVGQRLVYYVCQAKYKKIVSTPVENKSVWGGGQTHRRLVISYCFHMCHSYQ